MPKINDLLSCYLRHLLKLLSYLKYQKNKLVSYLICLFYNKKKKKERKKKKK
jgi:hypothetical protein